MKRASIDSSASSWSLGKPRPAYRKALPRSFEQLLRKLHDASGILDHLNGLDAGQLVEEPAAARVHQHRVPLQLQQLPDFHLLGFVQLAFAMALQEGFAHFGRTVQHHLDVVVARRPGVVDDNVRMRSSYSGATSSRSQSSACRNGARHS